MLSCPARRQSSHYLPAKAPPCWCEVCPVSAGSALLLQSPPCCHGYTLLRSLSVVGGCLGNGRLRQQWACTSVGADCLGNGGRFSPTELHHPGFSCARIRSVWNCHFVCPTALPQSLLPWNLLGWLTVQVPFSLKFSPLKSQIASSTGHPDQCALCGALCITTTLQRRPSPPHRLLAAPAKTSAWRPVSLLYLGISPFCGQQRSIWKYGPDSPSPRIHQELQSWIVLIAPS